MNKYNFSITQGSLFPKDSWEICLVYLECKDWTSAKEKSKSSPLFVSVKDKTFDTKFGLIKSRIETIPFELWDQMDVYEDFVHLLYLATCLRHKFFGDFVIEVVREQHLLMQNTLTEDHFRSYLFKKMDDHPEVEELQEYTQKKIRQNFMRILSEAKILESTKKWRISNPLISDFLYSKVKEVNSKYLKYFLKSDFEIKNSR